MKMKKLVMVSIVALGVMINVASASNKVSYEDAIRGDYDATSLDSCAQMCDDIAFDPTNTDIGGFTAYAACMAGCMTADY